MNIVVTGGLGHIGTFFLSNCHKLKKIKDIYVIDKIDQRMLNLINLKAKKKNFFINQNLSKERISLSKKKKIDFVIHLASITNAVASLKHKDYVYQNNLSCFNFSKSMI